MMAELALGALLGGALAKFLEPLGTFNRTGTGLPNTYTPAAAVAVLAYRPFVERALALVPGAILSSAYRAPEVNSAVGGVVNSDHLTGRAFDLVPPQWQDPAAWWRAVEAVRAEVDAGRLGPVRQFIAETYKGCIHLGFYPVGKTGPVQHLEQTAPGEYRALGAKP